LKGNAQARAYSALRLLLQEKHLYQSVEIETSDLRKEPNASERRPLDKQTLIDQQTLIDLAKPWRIFPKAGAPSGDGLLQVQMPGSLKLFCCKCQRGEAYNPVDAKDLSAGEEGFGQSRHFYQHFGLSYQCQMCKRTPESFLVRRDNLKLTLCGRAPMEYVEVPHVIPKERREDFSVALVAHQSGKTLCANFMLRTLIEQWVRGYTGKRERVDCLLEAYAANLSKEFRDTFPSLGSIYEELSQDIHDAKGSPELFESAKQRIIRHFDARRVFNLKAKAISESPPDPPGSVHAPAIDQG
jgi:hypothetical protein